MFREGSSLVDRISRPTAGFDESTLCYCWDEQGFEIRSGPDWFVVGFGLRKDQGRCIQAQVIIRNSLPPRDLKEKVS